MDTLKNNDYVKFNSDHFELQKDEYVFGYVEKVNIKPNNHKEKREYVDFYILDYKLNTKQFRNAVQVGNVLCLRNEPIRGIDLITDPEEISRLEKLKALHQNN